MARCPADSTPLNAGVMQADSMTDASESNGKRDAASWLYSAPQAKGTSEPTLTTRLGESTQSLDVTRGFAAAQAPAEQAIAMAGDPFTRPVLLGLEQNADAVMPAWAHQQALRRLLLPETTTSELPPLQGWEEAMARGHLKAVLHNAESVSAAALDEIDDWLAEVLCNSWPRSAPLVEVAGPVFGWGDERGQLSGRPAVSLLNSRLRGMQFAEQVKSSGHPLHKAWMELSLPAPLGSRRSWSVKRSDVAKLLADVRRISPELERNFDASRIALWEGRGTLADHFGPMLKGLVFAIALVVLILVVRSTIS